MQQISSLMKRPWFAIILDGCVLPFVIFVSETVASVGVKRDGEIVVVKQGYDDHEADLTINWIVPI